MKWYSAQLPGNLKPQVVEQIDIELQTLTKTLNFILQDVKWKRMPHDSIFYLC